MLIISTNNENNSLVAREKAAGELVFVEKDDNLENLIANEEQNLHKKLVGKM